MSMQRSAASGHSKTTSPAFAEDVAYYLTLTPRQLPSRYLYDELGSTLFEAICRLPWYHITRTEQRLLETNRRAIFERLGSVSRVIELGPGSGEKLVTLLDGQPENLIAHLVDVSAAALDKATAALSDGAPRRVVIHEATYEAGLADVTRSGAAGRTLVAFLGSNIGNFDPPGVDAFLATVRASLARGDALLLGTDLIKPEAELLLAYDDPLGVTGAFNRNLLVRVNRELGGDFNVDRFGHRVIWNASEARVEMHLVSLDRQRVRVPAAQIDVTFDIAEPIWTESSYKYEIGQLAPMLARAGFRLIGQWIENAFALTLGEAI